MQRSLVSTQVRDEGVRDALRNAVRMVALHQNYAATSEALKIVRAQNKDLLGKVEDATSMLQMMADKMETVGKSHAEQEQIIVQKDQQLKEVQQLLVDQETERKVEKATAAEELNRLRQENKALEGQVAKLCESKEKLVSDHAKALKDADQQKEKAIDAVRSFTWHNCLTQFRNQYGGYSVRSMMMDRVLINGALHKITSDMDMSVFDQEYPTEPDEPAAEEDEEQVDYEPSPEPAVDEDKEE